MTRTQSRLKKLEQATGQPGKASPLYAVLSLPDNSQGDCTLYYANGTHEQAAEVPPNVKIYTPAASPELWDKE